MTENHSDRTNGDVFFDYFCAKTGVPREVAITKFQELYSTIYRRRQKYTTLQPEAVEVLRHARQNGLKIVLATNPQFFTEAIRARLSWAGLHENYFDFIKMAFNFTRCKPSLDYFRAICQKLGMQPEDCLVVGDEADDRVAGQLGCSTFHVPSLMSPMDPSAFHPTYVGDLRDLIEFLNTGTITPKRGCKGKGGPKMASTQKIEAFNCRVERISATLTQGFLHYPLCEWLVPDEQTREKKLRGFERLLARFCSHHGTVYSTSAQCEGALLAVDSTVDQGPLAPLR